MSFSSVFVYICNIMMAATVVSEIPKFESQSRIDIQKIRDLIRSYTDKVFNSIFFELLCYKTLNIWS